MSNVFPGAQDSSSTATVYAVLAATGAMWMCSTFGISIASQGFLPTAAEHGAARAQESALMDLGQATGLGALAISCATTKHGTLWLEQLHLHIPLLSLEAILAEQARI
jgi:hypothetical protein